MTRRWLNEPWFWHNEQNALTEVASAFAALSLRRRCTQVSTLLHLNDLLRDCTSQVFQGKTPWVDQSFADSPGFPVLGAGDTPPPKLHPGASECAPGLGEFVFMALRANSWISCPQLPTTRARTGRTAHVFATQGGTHRVFSWPGLRVFQWPMTPIPPAWKRLPWATKVFH